jgi:hypothetical protein
MTKVKKAVSAVATQKTRMSAAPKKAAPKKAHEDDEDEVEKILIVRLCWVELR